MEMGSQDMGWRRGEYYAVAVRTQLTGQLDHFQAKYRNPCPWKIYPCRQGLRCFKMGRIQRLSILVNRLENSIRWPLANFEVAGCLSKPAVVCNYVLVDTTRVLRIANRETTRMTHCKMENGDIGRRGYQRLA